MKRLFVLLANGGFFVLALSSVVAQPTTTEQFMSALGTCAAGMNLNLSADILGSIKSIYEGSKTEGRFTLKNAPEFLSLFPESQRKDVYEVYVGCVTKILGISQPRISPEQVRICTATLKQCKDDFKIDVAHSMESCRKYVECDDKNPEAYSLLGQSYRTAGQLQNAEQSFDRQLQLGRQFDDQNIIAQAYQSLGITYAAKQAFDKAEQLINKSLEINLKRNKTGVAANYKALADIQLRRGFLPSAESYFLKGISIAREIDDKYGLGNLSLGLAFTKLKMGDRAASCSNLLQAKNSFAEIGFTRGVTDAQRYMKTASCN